MEPDDAGAAGLVKIAEHRIADTILQLWESFGLGEDGLAKGVSLIAAFGRL